MNGAKSTQNARAFFCLGLVAFVAASFGSDVFARVKVGGETLEQAISEHLYNAVVQPISTVLLFAPFAALGFVSARVGSNINRVVGLLHFVPFVTALLTLYFQGYEEAQYFFLEEKWTAAALSIGLLPLYSLLIVGTAYLLSIFIVKEKKKSRGEAG